MYKNPVYLAIIILYTRRCRRTSESSDRVIGIVAAYVISFLLNDIY